VLEFGVVYGTPQTKLESIPDMVKEIVVGLSTTDFDRCHLKSFGSSALEFETVYYVNSADYNQHMDILQQVHHAIYSRFTQAKIEFALPTQTVFVRKG
jgi:small-conductance mechanosensitive channel